MELCQSSGLAGLGVADTTLAFSLGGEKRPSCKQGITCVHWALGDLRWQLVRWLHHQPGRIGTAWIAL